MTGQEFARVKHKNKLETFVVANPMRQSHGTGVMIEITSFTCEQTGTVDTSSH